MIAHTGLIEERVIGWMDERTIEQWPQEGAGQESARPGPDNIKEEYEHQDNHIWLRNAKMEEERNTAIQRILHQQSLIEARYEEKNEIRRQHQNPPAIGDLVLLRSFAVDKDKGRKLSPRWEGPYLVYKRGKSGVSVTLKDLHTVKVKGRYSLDSTKVYIPREKRTQEGIGEKLVNLRIKKGRKYNGSEALSLDRYGVEVR